MGSIFFPNRGPAWRWAAYPLLAAAALAAAGIAGLGALGWWVDFSDEPAPADAIVVLAGSYSRPPYAADLFQKGLAPEVWLSRPAPYSADDKVRELGIRLPLEEDVNREILLKKGVPASALKLYGRGVLSTADEALSFAREYGFQGKRILVVTSRYHARRAKRIFRARLPGAEVRVVATPYDDPIGQWLKNKFLAQLVVLEGLKTAFYFGGGRFVGPAPAR